MYHGSFKILSQQKSPPLQVIYACGRSELMTSYNEPQKVTYCRKALHPRVGVKDT